MRATLISRARCAWMKYVARGATAIHYAHAAAPALVELHKPLLFHCHECLSDWHAAYGELLCKASFGKRGANGELSGHDGASDSGCGVFSEAET